MTLSNNLPPHADIEQYKKQSKDLLKAFKAQHPTALRRFGVSHPRLRKLMGSELVNETVKLADAQLVIAAELGFDRWQDLGAAVRSQSAIQQIVPTDQVERQRAFHRAGREGDVQYVERLLASDSSLVHCVDDEDRSLLAALPYQQQLCEGLNPALVAIYQLLRKAGSGASMLAAVRANDVDTVGELINENLESALDGRDDSKPSPFASPFVMAADNGHEQIVDLILNSVTVPEAEIRAAMERALLYSHFLVAERLLQTEVKFIFDCLGNTEFQNPERKIGRKHECIELLIAHGASWTDDPIMAIHRGQVDRLRAFIDADPDLLHQRESLDYGMQLTLREVTLLHVAVEFNERECVDLLLQLGADLNAQAGFEASGIGGQTPLYHAIGGNQGQLFGLFKHLMAFKPDLNVTAQIQVGPLYDEPPEEILALTPLGYAERYAEAPVWRRADREVEIISAALAKVNQ
jgi:ankyrin repeat protein